MSFLGKAKNNESNFQFGSSIAEIRRQADASRIIKGELVKLKKEEVTNPALQKDLLISADIQVDDINEAKRILRKNLSTIMPMEKIDEIVSDPNLVDDSNIQLINESWKEFSRQLKDGTGKLSLDRFKVVFKKFVDELKDPVDEQQLSKLQYIEQALRDIALEQSKYAPQIEKVINDLNDTNLSLSDINDIIGMVNESVINLQDITEKINGVKKEDDDNDNPNPERDIIDPNELDPNVVEIALWTDDDIKKESTNLIRDYGKDYANKITPLKEQFKQFLISAPPEDVQNAIDKLRDAELKAYNDAIRGLSKPKERLQLNTLLPKINPVVREFRNNKLEEYLANNMKPNEAKQRSLEDSKSMFGYGMKMNPLVEFGVLMLNINKLKNENKLKLTYKNGSALKEIKLTPVSDKFIDMVMDILQGKKFSDRKFSLLTEDEKYLYKIMLKKAQLAGDLDVRLDKLTSSSVDKLKNDWELVIGEINAGNDSPQLIKRAKELVKMFMDKRMISKTEGLNMLMNIN